MKIEHGGTQKYHLMMIRGVVYPRANCFLPSTEKSSSLPGSSRELAEIFGTSDDEEDKDFPFSLNADKTFPDLNLADGRVSEFFKSINSLTVPGTMESTLASSPDMAGEKLITGLPNSVGSSKSGMDEKDGVNVVSGSQGVNTASGIDSDQRKARNAGVEGVKSTDTCDVDTTPPGSQDSSTVVTSSKGRN